MNITYNRDEWTDDKRWEYIRAGFYRNYPQYENDVMYTYPCGWYELMIVFKDDTRCIYNDIQNKIRRVIGNRYDVIEEDDEKWKNDFKNNLTKRISVCGKPQWLIARETGLSEITISKYVNGKCIPNALHIQKIARCLSCSVDELLYP